MSDILSRSYILFCMYPLCCPLPLCIHGNSCLLGSTTSNLQCLNRLDLIMFIVGNIHQFLSVVDQCEWGFKLCCIFTGVKILKWGWHQFDSYWLNHNIQLWCWYSCQQHYVLWQCLTIIFMVFRTILILHSSAKFYGVNGLICFLLMFVSFAKLIKPYQYSI